MEARQNWYAQIDLNILIQYEQNWIKGGHTLILMRYKATIISHFKVQPNQIRWNAVLVWSGFKMSIYVYF